jgi:spore coat protein JC
MWKYEKMLQFPVNIKNPNPAMAKFIISQYGGPDGEIGASLRYLSQRYSMPYREVAGVLTDVGIDDFYCALYNMCVRRYFSRDREIHIYKHTYRRYDDACRVFHSTGLSLGCIHQL